VPGASPRQVTSSDRLSSESGSRMEDSSFVSHLLRIGDLLFGKFWGNSLPCAGFCIVVLFIFRLARYGA